MPLTTPWNHIEETLTTLQDFDLGAQRISDFFKGKEEKFSPDELLDLFFQGNPPLKILERLLFFLFDIGVPDRQTGSRALQLRRLRRLWKRIGAGSDLTESEHELADKTEWLFGLDPAGVEAGVAATQASFQKVLDGGTLPEGERTSLVSLIRSGW